MATRRDTYEEEHPNPFEGLRTEYICFYSNRADVYFAEDQRFSGMDLMKLEVEVAVTLRADVEVSHRTDSGTIVLSVKYMKDDKSLKDEQQLRELADPYCTTLASKVEVEIVREGRRHVATLVKVAFKGMPIDHYHLDDVAAELNGDSEPTSVERLYWDPEARELNFALREPQFDDELDNRVVALLRNARIQAYGCAVKIIDADPRARLIPEYDYRPPAKSRRRASTGAPRSTKSAS